MRMLGIAAAVAVLVSPVAAGAQDFTSDEIICKLEPSVQASLCPLKRSLVKSGGALLTGAPNSVDLTVNFDYNSSILPTDARINLDKLGAALTSPQLAGKKFRVGGHTDKSGSPRQNLYLSERRARAVRDYLIAHFHIPASHLAAEGFGSTQLALPNDHENAANRRVEIVNLTPTAKN